MFNYPYYGGFMQPLAWQTQQPAFIIPLQCAPQVYLLQPAVQQRPQTAPQQPVARQACDAPQISDTVNKVMCVITEMFAVAPLQVYAEYGDRVRTSLSDGYDKVDAVMVSVGPYFNRQKVPTEYNVATATCSETFVSGTMIPVGADVKFVVSADASLIDKLDAIITESGMSDDLGNICICKAMEKCVYLTRVSSYALGLTCVQFSKNANNTINIHLHYVAQASSTI